MKTIMVWNVLGEVPAATCCALAQRGFRLLMMGSEPHALEALDSELAQSELHRHVTEQAASDVDSWVRAQQVGLDGIVLFPRDPAEAVPEGGLLTPRACIEEAVRCGLTTPLELLRQLQRTLNRGKKPKRVWLALAWEHPFGGLTPMQRVLREAWRQGVRELAHELSWSEVLVNAVWLGAMRTQAVAAELERRAEQAECSVVDYERSVARTLPLRRLPTVATALSPLIRLVEGVGDTMSGEFIDLSGSATVGAKLE